MDHRTYIALTVFVLVGATLMAGSEARQTAVEKDLKRLEGTWEAVGAVVDGVKQGPRKGKGHRLVIRADSYTLEASGKPFAKGTLKVDPSKKPPALDLIPSEGDTEGKTIPCIYEIKGDELRVCVGRIEQARPSEFDAKEGSKHMLNIYRRLPAKE
jgi:uncharacterized protein (TIGR03067 family)